MNTWLFLNKFFARGKTVIHFTTHGCQGQIEEFDYIGIIVGTVYPPYCQGQMFFKVQVLKNKLGYNIKDSTEIHYREIPAWIQPINDIYFAYD